MIRAARGWELCRAEYHDRIAITEGASASSLADCRQSGRSSSPTMTKVGAVISRPIVPHGVGERDE